MWIEVSTFFNLDNVFQSSVISQNGFIKSKQSVLSTGNYRYGKNMEILISIKKSKSFIKFGQQHTTTTQTVQ